MTPVQFTLQASAVMRELEIGIDLAIEAVAFSQQRLQRGETLDGIRGTVRATTLEAAPPGPCEELPSHEAVELPVAPPLAIAAPVEAVPAVAGAPVTPELAPPGDSPGAPAL
mgnify:CR=1 FL=1